MDIEEEQKSIEQQKLINEEYKIWKKNSPLLYDLMYARALEWPTLTVQWFPDKKNVPGTDLYEHRLLIGTQTSGLKGARDYIEIAKLEMPDFGYPDPKQYDAQTEEIGGYGSAKKPFEFEVVQKMCHDGDVNKARYMPQNPNIIASLSSTRKTFIFDRTVHPLVPKDEFVPQMILNGHTEEGFGLSWNPKHEGQLATGASDGTVCLYNINDFTKDNRHDFVPERIFTHHHSSVNDVQFHPSSKHLLGTVSDDKSFQVLDLRKDNNTEAALYCDAGSDAINCLAFHPSIATYVATGSADHTIAWWDLRNLKKKVNSTEVHHSDVIKLEWHPTDHSILASASYDRRINILDLSKIGAEQTPEEAEDGPPEQYVKSNFPYSSNLIILTRT